jgi:fibro-slime domain-containing protein
MSTMRLGIACCVATGACAGLMALNACGANGSPSGFGAPMRPASSSGAGGSSGSSGSSGGSTGGGTSGGTSGGGSFLTDGGVVTSDDGGGNTPPSVLMGVVRDFRFYEAGNPMTDMDFENPPNTGGGWDDHAITMSQASDGTPAYAGDPTMGTLTTYGNGQTGDALTEFNNWYHDVAGINIHVDYPLPIAQNATGSYGYDSEQQGAPYDPTNPDAGRGFFPIDDGTQYATAFGNQGELHNYSFTFELHTVFTYRGGEFFNFRGDDDVFVFINHQLVINLGGIHGPEPAQVSVDTLGLTLGQTYPLDFFSAERHVVGSNILFETTLNLQPPPQ